MSLALIILVMAAGFYMLWSMGANDVANAMGTSVGSGAVTLKKAILIAAVLEFSGAFFLGNHVSQTIQKGIVDIHFFSEVPVELAIGMLGSLFAAAIWVQAATHLRLPVSTTHAIIGAIVGFGVVSIGRHAIYWHEIGAIALSWIISPTMSAILAYIFFLFVQRSILFSYRPLHATQKIAPFLVFLVIFTFLMTTVFDGVRQVGYHISFETTTLIAAVLSTVFALLSLWVCKKVVQSAKAIPFAPHQEQQLYSLNKIHKHLTKAKLASTGPTTEKIDSMLDEVNGLMETVAGETSWRNNLSDDYLSVEKIFAGLQVLSACFVAFAHGSNDVSNAIGPISSVLGILHNPTQLSMQTTLPTWLLAFGGLGIVFGLVTYGWRIIETIGKHITELSPTRGFCAEFGAATTIITASHLGLPISTTYCVVGAVLGVGLARGLEALNLRLLRDIILSWVVTLPSTAVISVGFYFILKAIFL